jgi:hypothetical protein
LIIIVEIRLDSPEIRDRDPSRHEKESPAVQAQQMMTDIGPTQVSSLFPVEIEQCRLEMSMVPALKARSLVEFRAPEETSGDWICGAAFLSPFWRHHQAGEVHWRLQWHYRYTGSPSFDNIRGRQNPVTETTVGTF